MWPIMKISKSPNLKSIRIKLPGWSYEVVKVRNPETPVCGLTSKTECNKHILCLDYDLVDLNVVMMDIEMLKVMIKPSLIFLLTTYQEEDELGILGNYHTIILDKFTFREAERIMRMTHSDAIHRKLANKSRYRSWVLRITNKGDRDAPKLLKTIQLEGKRECSYAHYLLLKSLYKFKIKKEKVKFDKSTKTTMTFYNTASKLEMGKND